MTSAIIVSAGSLEIEGGRIGPGGDAAIIALGRSRLSIRRLSVQRAAEIIGHMGYGLYGTDRARVSVSDTKISRVSGGVAVVFDDHSRIDLSGNTINGPPNQPAISVAGEAEAEIIGNRISIFVGNRLVDPDDRNWLIVAPTAFVTRILENLSGSGQRLRAPRSSRRRPRG